MEAQTYIAFLRGINIGGHQLKMEHLRQLITELRLQNVSTFIQTGNVFFDSTETDILALQRKIEQHLHTSLGYEVPTFIYTIEAVQQILEEAPFTTIPLNDNSRHMIVFTQPSLPPQVDLPLKSPKGNYELVGTGERVMYIVIHLLNGRLESSDYFEKLFHVTTTSRFYHTTQKILQAALNK